MDNTDKKILEAYEKVVDDKYLNEAVKKKRYVVKAAGDGYAINGPLKAGEWHGKKVRSYADDGLFDTYYDATKKILQMGGAVIERVQFTIDLGIDSGGADITKKQLKEHYAKKLKKILEKEDMDVLSIKS